MLYKHIKYDGEKTSKIVENLKRSQKTNIYGQVPYCKPDYRG